WFPVSRLYRLQVGDAVTVSTGGATCPTKIAKVSVIADALPKEFQNAFAPIDGTRWLETSQRDHIGESSPAKAGSAPPSLCPAPRLLPPARHRAFPPEREWPAKRYPADALPFGMQYCLRKLREPAINENSCGRRSRLNSRGFARRSKKTHARCGHIGGLKLRS